MGISLSKSIYPLQDHGANKGANNNWWASQTAEKKRCQGRVATSKEDSQEKGKKDSGLQAGEE